MEIDKLYESNTVLIHNIQLFHDSYPIAGYFIVAGILIILSALVSGSEIAFLMLTTTQKEHLRIKNTKLARLILKITNNPEKLYTTLLTAKNFFNIVLTILLFYLYMTLSTLSIIIIWKIVIGIVGIFLFIFIFCELLPKLYGTSHPFNIIYASTYVIGILEVMFYPLTILLSKRLHIISKLMRSEDAFFVEQIPEDLEAPSQRKKANEKGMLKGIIRFRNIEVKDIMKSRIDVNAVDLDTNFPELLSVITNSGYSRIPVYHENFDNVKGILYVKDLLPYMGNEQEIEWQQLVRPPYFVSESKKINTLLEEFRTYKIHMAIVLDEYGGTSGIVTLEDIIEEIVGEIKDEFDTEKTMYYKINDRNFIFAGKVSVNDFCKVTNTDDSIFDGIKGDAETLAGLILEIKGELPTKDETIIFKHFEFTIKSVDERKIKIIKVKINEHKE